VSIIEKQKQIELPTNRKFFPPPSANWESHGAKAWPTRKRYSGGDPGECTEISN